MEERKQRITRKYLRERAEITYSEVVVPDAEIEGEEVLASEKYKQPQVSIQRQEGGVVMPQPMRRPAPRVENSNWLLSESSELADPYADPFAPKASSVESKEKADWTTWGTERNVLPYAESQRESRFNQRGSEDSFGNQQSRGYDSTQQGFFNPRDPRSGSTESMSSGFRQESSVWGRSSFSGRQQVFQSPSSMDALDLSRDKTIRSSQSQSRLQSPYSREMQSQSGRSEFRSSTQSGSGIYTPYKSSFQTQYEQRQQQRGGGYGQQPQQEFQKQNTFQQWKEKNPIRYDPTADDAFIQEMMPKTRR